jgi:aminopeptidase-like protein
MDILEHDRILVNLKPKCEPQLGRRGLYAGTGGDTDARSKNMSLL